MSQKFIQPNQIDIDTDGTLSADSDSKIPSQKAIKAYVDNNAGGGGGSMDELADDTSPTLGGNLDISTYAVGAATAADLTKLHAVTASASELNTLDGVTATTAELNTLDGITATVTELNYTDGVTSPIQTQLDAKAPLASPTFTGTVTLPTGLSGLAKLTSGVVSAATANTDYATPNQDTTGKSAKTDALNSATTVVNVASATAPSTGQVLTATDATHATWQTPSGGGGSGMTWTVVTADTTMVTNNGYISNKSSLCVLTLPASTTVGSVIRIAGSGINGWKIAQNASQKVYINGLGTTTGTGGYLQSTNSTGDAIEIVCTATNEYRVISMMGNITIV